MMKKLLLTISLFATITSAFCQEDKIVISPLPITLFENPSINIFNLAQDKFGNIWMAHSRDGIVRYDGGNTIWYAPNADNPYAIVGGRLEEIFIDKEGYIWISTSNQGLEKFDPETEIFTHFKHDLDNPKSIRSNRVRSFLQDDEGFIWIGTDTGLDKYNPVSGEFNHIFSKDSDAETIAKEYINQLYQDKSGMIWIGCGTAFGDNQATGGLFKYDKKTDEITPYLHSAEINSLIDNRITALYEDRSGTFWVGTAGDGLHTMDRKKGTFQRHTYDPLNPQKLSRPPLGDLYSWADDYISFIEEDEFENIWIATYEGGINRYDPSSGTTTFLGMDEFGTKSFFSCLKTQDNLLWFAAWGNNITGENLFKVNTSFQGLENINLGPPALRIGDIVETEDKEILVGTTRGLKLMDTKGDIQNVSFNNDSLLSNLRFYGLEKNKSGNIWIIAEQGLFYYNSQTKSVTEYRHNPNDTNSISTNEISTTLQIDDKVFIGTELGLNVLNLNNGIFKRYFHDVNDVNTLVNDKVRALEQDHKGNLWIGTTNGICKFNASSGLFKRYGDSLLNINSIFEDSKQNLWASSSQRGLLHYDEVSDGFLPYFDKTGILTPTTKTVGIAEDKDNNLWTKTNFGFLRLNPSNGKAILFGKSWGINPVSSGGGNSKGILTTSDGDVLIGNHNGVVRFIPKYFQNEVQTFDPYISKFYVDNQLIKPGSQEYLPKPVSQTNEITLKSFQNSFALEYGHADFRTAPSEHLVQFRLKNLDVGWRNNSGENKASYYEVPPGKYVFQVRASNIYGVRTEKSLAITILPPWYKTYWAYAIYVLLLIVAIYAFHRFQKDRIVKAEREKARTKELEQAREIEKAYKELKATQAQLIQSEKMASLGELTAGIAHEIQNPLHFVNNFSEVSSELIDEMKEELKNDNKEDAIEIADDLKLNLEKINHHGNRASEIVKGMLQHSRTSTGEKEPTDLNALADEYLRLAYHGLRAKNKSFNADFKTEFDETIPKINVIPQDIGRVLLNLINNAFYVVDEKAKKGIDGYQPQVVVSTKKLQESVEISVKDNGEGIPEQVRDKIFQPFFTTKPTGSGTGLGLSLSYDIVKAHGGEIKVESKESEGTEFVIHLPVV